MNREWVTLAFGIILVAGVAMVSVWHNYPGQETATAATAAAQSPAETPAKTPAEAPPAEAPVQRPAASAAAPTRVSYHAAANTPATPPPTPRIDARLLVLHKHRFGDCQGTLRAVPGSLTYATDHKEDAFRLAFADVEALELDADKKNLRIRRRGGKTWNFTTRDETGTALTTFHKEAARLRR
jgi:hypothetical protein